MDYFKKSELDTLQKWAKTKCDRENNPDHQEAYNILKGLYYKIQYWAEETVDLFFPKGEVKIFKKPTNQGNKFEEYQWVRIYPNKEDLEEKWLAFTLTVATDGLFTVKIDTVGLQDHEEKRKKYLDYRGDYRNSRIIRHFPYEEVLSLNWEGLLKKTKNAIDEIQPHYAKLKKLLSGKIDEHSVFQLSTPLSLNTILYGPPGTGKTYQSKSKAVEIIDGSLPDTREEVNARYAELYEKEQIKFVTFHQSTTYEDFVEGIKPVMTDDEEENGNVQYRIEDGIFKRMCIQAAYEFIQLQNQNQASSKTLVFSQLFDQLVDEFGEKIGEEGKGVPIPLKSGNEILVTGISPNGNFLLQHFDGQTTYTVSKSRAERLYNEIEDFNSISNINTFFRNIIGGSNSSAYWAILNQIYQLSQISKPKEKQTVDFEVKKRAFERINWTNIDPKTAAPKYVLIIDEINRGNIAAILGELITLLEEDKRGGQEESLDVTLPYSKSKFSVSPNLYIIGTMNTADRSVEALDTALRRRFSFQEIAPKPELLSEYNIEGIALQPLLTTINRRIRKLLDKDHMIGHADFIKLSKTDASLDDLRNIFHNKLLPLLQEYFYGNFGKIQLVLGKAFIYDEEKDPVKDEKEKREPLRFAENDEDLEEEYSEKPVYLVRDVLSMGREDFKNALIKIYHPE